MKVYRMVWVEVFRCSCDAIYYSCQIVMESPVKEFTQWLARTKNVLCWVTEGDSKIKNARMCVFGI